MGDSLSGTYRELLSCLVLSGFPSIFREYMHLITASLNNSITMISPPLPDQEIHCKMTS